MKTIIEENIRIGQEQEKTNIKIPFELLNDAQELYISFSYNPKVLMNDERAKEKVLACLKHNREAFKEYTQADIEEYLPIVNLITLSLDDPNGYRGCAHRHAHNQKHTISEEKASYGFYKGKIVKGIWHIVLNVHAIVTEYCDCKIKVEVEE